jgi:hypothetical protein
MGMAERLFQTAAIDALPSSVAGVMSEASELQQIARLVLSWLTCNWRLRSRPPRGVLSYPGAYTKSWGRLSSARVGFALIGCRRSVLA